MFWFRTYLPQLIRLALVLWLVAFVVAVSQGCLSQPPHDLALPHEDVGAIGHADDHARHTSGCLQYCADHSTALSPSLQVPPFEHALWVAVLLLSVMCLSAVSPAPFAFLALQLPAPPRPPARIRFVRYND